jgi:NADP-dependent 3-hydroxy acid dehydrogenase YdfG
VADEDAVAAAADRVTEVFGPAGLVVNSAGVMLPDPIGAGRADEWHRMIDTNLTGTLLVILVFLPGLRAAAAAGRAADLVNISSIGAHVAFPDYAVYGLPRPRSPSSRPRCAPSWAPRRCG